MFEEYIAQGNDMIRRMQAEIGLSEAEVEALPKDRRVPTREDVAWRKAVEERIKSTFGSDALARYNLAWEHYREELDDGEGDERTRLINAWRRIVTYLMELEERLKTRSPGREDGLSEN